MGKATLSVVERNAAPLAPPENSAAGLKETFVGEDTPQERMGQLAALLFGLRGLRTCLAHLVIATAAVDEKIERTKDLFIAQQALSAMRGRVDEMYVPPSLTLAFADPVFPRLLEQSVGEVERGLPPRALAAALLGFVCRLKPRCLSVADEPTLMSLERVETLLRSLSPALRGEAAGAEASAAAYASRPKHPDAWWAELKWPALPARPAREAAMLRTQDAPRNPAAPQNLAGVHGTIFSIEIPAAEICAMTLARFEPLPDECETFLARQCWDEGRHAKAFLQYFRGAGGRVEDFPFDFDIWDDALRGVSPEEIICGEQVVGEGFNLGAESGPIEKHRAAGREAMARLLEYVYLDEVQHVRHGLSWFRRFAGDRADDILLGLEARTKVRPSPHFTFEVRRYVGFAEAEIARHFELSQRGTS
jgi:uncharacterized ferritin-like protein (DUF455 family)